MITNPEIEQRMKREDKFGKYNDFPPNFREISIVEFGQKLTNYTFDYSEYRQMWEDVYTKPAVSAMLFFFWDDTGLAITREGETYAFGCNHLMENVAWDRETMGPQYNCMHAYKCTKCGFIQTIDSSD